MSTLPPVTPPEPVRRGRFVRRLRTYLLTGLLALAPTAITLWVLAVLLNWMDNLLGRYLRFEGMHYQRIPGLGLVATFVLLLFVGWVATVFGLLDPAAGFTQFGRFGAAQRGLHLAFCFEPIALCQLG